MKIIIKTTKIYERTISKLLTLEQRHDMENQIADDPLNWPVIRGTGGIRKARFSRNAMGKRGGGRVCYLYMTVHETIYFLEAYAKSEKENISEQEKKRMKKKVEEIKNVMEKEDDNTVKHN